MTPITLRAATDLAPLVEPIVTETVARIATSLPDAEVHHIGATAIPGALTKGDVDVLVLVASESLSQAISVLGQQYAVKQRENWTAGFASFGDDTGYALPLGAQVVVRGSENDFLLYLRDYLTAHRSALEEYNQLKVEHAGADAQRYWEAKDAFFERILALRDPETADQGIKQTRAPGS